MLRVVLDTNVLVASISRKSPHFWIWESLLNSKFNLCVTTDILNEYAEIIERYFGIKTAEYAMNQLSLLSNVIPIVNYYKSMSFT
ncbi:MAG: PIN domain-containing protein [Sphingobacteriales bacterium]|nr:MAG: PIN domain-containing protein [Sphingobacteriales bacterium]